LERLRTEGWEIFDDYKARARDGSVRFRAGRRYGELIQSLRDGKRCAVADMAFCRPLDREEACSNLKEEVPGIAVSWAFIKNDPQQCAENIRADERPSESRLAKLDEFSPQYSAPGGTILLAIIRRERGPAWS
jgi:hypothetical protein